MSHARLRNEANCLNCDTEVIGRYCHVCGQENVEPQESFWSLVTHFFNDITHFHGKFFITLGNLVKKPGFLPTEYMRGRRARYLHPIRMYVFTSALFFLIFYTYTSKYTLEDRSTPGPVTVSSNLANDTINTPSFSGGYRSVEIYDSVQRSLPKEQQDNWLKRRVRRQSIKIETRYHGDPGIFARVFINGLVHSLPTLLFISLPIFAFFLKLLYLRSDYLYADHAIYLIFLYIFAFIVMLLYLLFDVAATLTGWSGLRTIIFLLLFYGFFYALLGMKNFYRQGWGKTLLKFSLFNVLAAATIIVLFVLFLVLTFFRV